MHLGAKLLRIKLYLENPTDGLKFGERQLEEIWRCLLLSMDTSVT
jgi:hypothetical protein